MFRERKEKRTMKEKMVKYQNYPCHIRGVHKWYKKKMVYQYLSLIKRLKTLVKLHDNERN